jgi:hypothetical protein
MLRLSSYIKIGTIEFDFCCSVEISSSWQNLTDTAKIIIPRKITFEGKNIVAGSDPIFKRGDKVEIQLGYDDQLKTHFEGYVTQIKPELPIEIFCEDAMWLLKQKVVTKSYPSVNLKTLLTDCIGNTLPFEATDINLGKFRITRATVAQVIEELRKTYGITSFIRGGKLFSGLAYYPSQRNEEVFDFTRNIIESDLEYKIAEDTKIKVEAISILSDNTKIEETVGDTDGEVRTMHYYNLSRTDLKATATREIDKLRYTGYRGRITTFGEPFVKHGDGAIIIDDKLTEKQGTYLIKAVNYTFGTSGFRQEIELDRKIA